MVLASRGEFYRAGWYIFFAGVLDALDGRVARLSRTGTRFGAELDSLVDIVSFGVAPAFLIYQLEFATGGQAEWIFCYFYVMAAAIRLARFNITQAGRAKRYFIGPAVARRRHDARDILSVHDHGVVSARVSGSFRVTT